MSEAAATVLRHLKAIGLFDLFADIIVAAYQAGLRDGYKRCSKSSVDTVENGNTQ